MIPAPVHEGRRLDWFPRFDERSLAHPMAAGPATPLPTVGRVWTPGRTLDQGREGACCGFGAAGEAAAQPVPVPGITNAYARGWYHNAQRRDQWPGEAYDGTSVLATCLEGRARGLYEGFTWGKRAEQLAAGIVTDGPAIVGVEWRDGCYSTDAAGVLRPSGRVVGGHCICLIGFIPADLSGMTGEGRDRLRADVDRLRLTNAVGAVLAPVSGEEGVFVGINSWGESFGVAGLFVVGIRAVRGWVAAGGEFAQPQGRKLPARKAAAVAPEEDEESGDATLHITAVEIQDGDRILDPPDGLGQESVTVRGTPRQVTAWGGRRVVIDSTAGVFQLGAGDAVTVRRPV